MTVEDAIIELEFVLSSSYVDEFTPEEREALKKVIQILKLDAKSAIDRIERWDKR